MYGFPLSRVSRLCAKLRNITNFKRSASYLSLRWRFKCRRGKTYTQVLCVPFHQLCNFVKQGTSFAGVHASPWRSQFKCCLGRFNGFVYVRLDENEKQRRIWSRTWFVYWLHWGENNCVRGWKLMLHFLWQPKCCVICNGENWGLRYDYISIVLTLSPSETSQIFWPVVGLMVGKVFPLTESTNSLLMKSWKMTVETWK